MQTHDLTSVRILVATDSTTDAKLVKDLLEPEFGHVFVSTEPALAVLDFDKYQPDVLVLAFNELAKSELYYLGLYRQSQTLQQHPHRTVILCSKEEVKRVYELCMKDYFDDYVLFWPMTYDASRLLMSVHYALRELSALKPGAPSVGEFAAHARYLAELEGKLDQQVTQGTQHIETANRAMEQARQGIGTALDGLSQRLVASPAGSGNPETLKNEINRFKQEEVHQHFNAAASSAQPLQQWAQGLKQECEPQLESVRALSAMAEEVRPVVLVVDDDEFQHKLIRVQLAEKNYRLIFAVNGVQTMGILRKIKPDVILMDVMMPDMDGMEVTRRIKRNSLFSKTPVIMITGSSDGQTVMDCVKAGASDFVVKPINRDILLAKLLHALNNAAPTARQ